jgi:hypothetical protein
MSFRVATDRSRGRLRRLRRALAVILTNAAKLGRDVRLAESGCVALDPWFFDKLPGGLPMTAEGVSRARRDGSRARYLGKSWVVSGRRKRRTLRSQGPVFTGWTGRPMKPWLTYWAFLLDLFFIGSFWTHAAPLPS